MWVVSWSSLSVPLSPWAMAMIAVLLMFATYAYKRRAHGLMGACLAVALGGGALQYNEAVAVDAATDLQITTPSGAGYLSCLLGGESAQIKAAAPELLSVTNASGSPVTLVEVRWTGAAGSPPPAAQKAPVRAEIFYTQCTEGMTLQTNQTCNLPCLGSPV